MDKIINTQAMKLAKQGIIPDEKYQHNPELKDNEGHTVCYYLWLHGIQVPENWQDEQYKHPQGFHFKNKTNALYSVFSGKIPDEKEYHNPNIQDADGNTVSICLSFRGIIPPKQWYHNPNIRNKQGCTVAQWLKYHEIPVPNEWYDNTMINEQKKPEFVQQAIYGIIPKKPDNIPADYDCGYGWTIAMLLAYNKVQNIPKEWQHKPELQNDKGYTVSIIYANNIMIPPQQWQHDPKLQTINGNTVGYFLSLSDDQIPKQWLYNTEYKLQCGKTTAMVLTQNISLLLKELKENNIIPSNDYSSQIYQHINQFVNQLLNKWYHNPNIQDNNGNTISMYLGKCGIIPSEKWQHNKYLRNNNGESVQMILKNQNISVPEEWKYEDYNGMLDKYYQIHPEYNDNENKQTFAMFLASNGIIPLDEWNHDKLLRNRNNQTVSIILSSKGIIPPEQWMHDINIKDKYGNSIKSNLKLWNYVYINNEFKVNVQTEIKQEVCCICLYDNEREFVRTQCGHNVCYGCYKELIKNQNYYCCPVCRNNNWVIPIYNITDDDNDDVNENNDSINISIYQDLQQIQIQSEQIMNQYQQQIDELIHE